MPTATRRRFILFSCYSSSFSYTKTLFQCCCTSSFLIKKHHHHADGIVSYAKRDIFSARVNVEIFLTAFCYNHRKKSPVQTSRSFLRFLTLSYTTTELSRTHQPIRSQKCRSKLIFAITPSPRNLQTCQYKSRSLASER